MCVKADISPCIVHMERPSALFLLTTVEARCLISAQAESAVVIKDVATTNIGVHVATQDIKKLFTNVIINRTATSWLPIVTLGIHVSEHTSMLVLSTIAFKWNEDDVFFNFTLIRIVKTTVIFTTCYCYL